MVQVSFVEESTTDQVGCSDQRWLFRPTIRRQFWARGEEQDGFGEDKGLKTNPSLLLQVP